MPERDPIFGRQIAPVKAQRAKDLRRGMTEAEAALWQCLRRNQLDGFHIRRQQIIDGFIADFYCHAACLVIEVDGGMHDERREYDAARVRLLAARKLRILRFSNEEVLHNLPHVLKSIANACNASTE